MPLALKDTDIRPISDLRNKFTEISDYVQGGNAVIFTKNGHGYMVTMSFDSFKSWCDPVIAELNRADDLCEADERHYTREESLKMLKERAHARRRKLHARSSTSWMPQCGTLSERSEIIRRRTILSRRRMPR